VPQRIWQRDNRQSLVVYSCSLAFVWDHPWMESNMKELVYFEGLSQAVLVFRLGKKKIQTRFVVWSERSTGTIECLQETDDLAKNFGLWSYFEFHLRFVAEAPVRTQKNLAEHFSRRLIGSLNWMRLPCDFCVSLALSQAAQSVVVKNTNRKFRDLLTSDLLW